jgi:hypothetical protein
MLMQKDLTLALCAPLEGRIQSMQVLLPMIALLVRLEDTQKTLDQQLAMIVLEVPTRTEMILCIAIFVLLVNSTMELEQRLLMIAWIALLVDTRPLLERVNVSRATPGLIKTEMVLYRVLGVQKDCMVH